MRQTATEISTECTNPLRALSHPCHTPSLRDTAVGFKEDRLQSLAFHTRRPEPPKHSNFKTEGRFHRASALGGASQSKNLASPQHKWADYIELKEWLGLESHAQVLERHTSQRFLQHLVAGLSVTCLTISC